MIGRRAVTGLMLLTGLVLCAFTAQSASAATAVNTTAFTCVKGGSGQDFKDAHCDTFVGTNGEYDHEAIAADTTTAVDATNQKVTSETKSNEVAALRGTLGGGKIEFSCATVKTDTEKSFVHNVEVEGKHTVKGTARVLYSDCDVLLTKGCIIAEPVTVQATFEGVEKLGAGGNEMGLEFKGEGSEERFAEVTFPSNKANEACALKGTTFPVKGSVVATSGPTTESPQTIQWTGSTLVFTPKNEMQKLKLGPNTAEFFSIVTPTMAGGGNPLSGTTVT